MEKVKTIVAALDLAAGSDAVLTRAIQVADAHAARLVALHVVEAEPLARAATHMNLGEGELRDQFRRQAIAVIESRLAESGGARRVEVQVDFGAPHEIITHAAGERRADFVVVGPGKAVSLKERVLGSTADRVIRTSPASVLVVRRHSGQPYRRVAVAVDLSPQSARAVTEARRLAPGAVLQLVHAVDIPLAFEQAMLRVGTSQIEMERYRSARADKARHELSAFQRDLTGAEELPVRVLDGAPGGALVRLSRGRRIDLLALGPHGRSIVSQALLGGVAQRVLREARCDVLVTSSR